MFVYVVVGGVLELKRKENKEEWLNGCDGDGCASGVDWILGCAFLFSNIVVQ